MGVPNEIAGTTPIDTGLASSWWWKRMASRMSRLIRFRRTALPCFRERNTPYRNASEGNQITVRLPSRQRRPSLKSLSMASFPLRAHERGSLFCPGNCGCEAFTPLSTAAGQYQTATFGFHPLTETVIVDEFAVRWLKRSLHFLFLIVQLDNIHNTGGRSRGRQKYITVEKVVRGGLGWANRESNSLRD